MRRRRDAGGTLGGAVAVVETLPTPGSPSRTAAFARRTGAAAGDPPPQLKTNPHRQDTAVA